MSKKFITIYKCSFCETENKFESWDSYPDKWFVIDNIDFGNSGICGICCFDCAPKSLQKKWNELNSKKEISDAAL